MISARRTATISLNPGCVLRFRLMTRWCALQRRTSRGFHLFGSWYQHFDWKKDSIQCFWRRGFTSISDQPAVKTRDQDVRFPGARRAPYTNECRWELSDAYPVIPAFRLIDERGKWLPKTEQQATPHFPSDETIRTIYQVMIRLNVMDNLLYAAQRQGRISFYMTCYGEEAAVVASAAALNADDEVFAQYREQGVLMWRGYTYDDFCLQCCGHHGVPFTGIVEIYGG